MTVQKQNILVLVAARTVNTGPVKGVLQFIRDTRDADVHFHLFNFWRHNLPFPEAFSQDTLACGVPSSFIRVGRHNYFRMILDTIHAIQSRKITVIQTHGFKPTFVGFCMKYLCGVKWVCFMHGTTSESFKVKFYHFIDSILQKFADHVVLVSESQRSKIPGGGDLQRVSVLHNAVNIHHPVRTSEKAEDVRRNFGIPDDAYVIAVVGRLSPEKGIDVFIDAFHIARLSGRELYAFIVGEGQEREALGSRAADRNCADRIFFVGHTPTPGDYMTAADMIVLPSRSEGIPNVALEAMALGKPVVATAVGGTPEVIEHGKSGLLVPSENPEAMAQAILQIADDPDFAGRLSEGAVLRVKEHFSIERRCAKLVDIYRSKLNRKE